MTSEPLRKWSEWSDKSSIIDLAVTGCCCINSHKLWLGLINTMLGAWMRSRQYGQPQLIWKTFLRSECAIGQCVCRLNLSSFVLLRGKAEPVQLVCLFLISRHWQLMNLIRKRHWWVVDTQEPQLAVWSLRATSQVATSWLSCCISFIFLTLHWLWNTADKFKDQNKQNNSAELG